MNLVFLLLTAAVSAGSDPTPVIAPVPGTVIYPEAESAPEHAEKPTFFGRFREMFTVHHKEKAPKGDCGCGCGAPAPVCTSCAPTPTCTSCKPAKAPACTSCAPAPVCESCKPAKAPVCASCAPAPVCDAGKPAPCDTCGAPKARAFGGFFTHKQPAAACGTCAPTCGCDTCGGGAVISTPTYAPTPVMGMPSPAVMPSPASLPSAPKTAEPLEMPKGQPDKKISGLTPTSATGETDAKNPFDLDRRYENRVSRSADYSKLTGQLFYVHLDGGLWVLRYASLGTEDANGGSVIISRDWKMDNYREGDLVSVEGQVQAQKGSYRLGGPLYRVYSITLVDRPLQ